MFRELLIDLAPWGVTLTLIVGALAVLIRGLAPRDRSSAFVRLALLHNDQTGSVQSLSFVLTVPAFIMLMLLTVQVTQLMLGMIGVHYSAFVAARAATVWIPARYGNEAENCIGVRTNERRVKDGHEYRILPVGAKYERIRSAAIIACLPISPSRDLPGMPQQGNPISDSVLRVYRAVSPASQANTRLPRRLANKWAYAAANTDVEVEVFHRRDEPLLTAHHPYRGPWDANFAPNEIGYRDLITVKVTHRFALLPGPGRLLARPVSGSSSGDPTAAAIGRAAGVYFVPLSASARLPNEGEKSLVAYVQSKL